MDTATADSWAPDAPTSFSMPHPSQLPLQPTIPHFRPSMMPRAMALTGDDFSSAQLESSQNWDDVFAARPHSGSTMPSYYDCVPTGNVVDPVDPSSTYAPPGEELLNYTASPGPASQSVHDIYDWPQVRDPAYAQRLTEFDQQSPFHSVEDSFPPSVYQIQTQEPSTIPTDRPNTFPGYLPFEPVAPEAKPQHDEFTSPATTESNHLCLADTFGPDFPPPTNITGANPEAKTPSRNGDESGPEKEEPYAKLIYRALLQAPNHTMVLRDIYTWFRRNTDKGKDPDTKGWQNSIRHNLSMNGAFKKVDQPPGDEAKKGFMWRLDEVAVREGVKSTTRFRSKQGNKRSKGSHLPAPQRQASGAKGGQATKRNARLRRTAKLDRIEDVPTLNGPTHAYRFPYPPGLPQLQLPTQPNFTYDAHDLLFPTSTPPLTAPSPYYTSPSQLSPYHEDPALAPSRPQTSASATDEPAPQTPLSSAFDDYKFSPAALDDSPAASPAHETLQALEFKFKPVQPFFYDSPPSDRNEPVTPQSVEWPMDLAGVPAFDPTRCHDDFNRWL